ncbi:MAG: hypothetical protein HYW78_02270 [Parcubacteria group bacterium]|nr:hypothetical protein [Parcubacteria group bacterium]
MSEKKDKNSALSEKRKKYAAQNKKVKELKEQIVTALQEKKKLLKAQHGGYIIDIVPRGLYLDDKGKWSLRFDMSGCEATVHTLKDLLKYFVTMSYPSMSDASVTTEVNNERDTVFDKLVASMEKVVKELTENNKKTVSLSKKWQEVLKKYPESGMGYQYVAIRFGNGSLVRNVVVVNSDTIEGSEKLPYFTEDDIVEIIFQDRGYYPHLGED